MNASTNPYAPPESDNNPSPAFFARFVHFAVRHPATIVSVSFATWIGIWAAAIEYDVQLRLARGETVLQHGTPLGVFDFPGALPMYVLGTLTKSTACAWMAFASGMVVFYGGM